MHRVQQFHFLSAILIVLLVLSCNDNTGENCDSYVSTDFLGTNSTKQLQKFSFIDSFGVGRAKSYERLELISRN